MGYKVSYRIFFFWGGGEGVRNLFVIANVLLGGGGGLGYIIPLLKKNNCTEIEMVCLAA